MLNLFLWKSVATNPQTPLSCTVLEKTGFIGPRVKYLPGMRLFTQRVIILNS